MYDARHADHAHRDQPVRGIQHGHYGCVGLRNDVGWHFQLEQDPSRILGIGQVPSVKFPGAWDR